MRVQVLSDIHVEFHSFEPPDVDADVVILAGDIHVKDKGLEWAIEKFPHTPVLYVLGNHEYYGAAIPKQLKKIKAQAEGTQVRILENEAVVINNTKFLCCTLWTDFNLFGDPRIAGHEASQVMTDYRKIRVSPEYRKLRSVDTVAFHHRSLRWLRQEVESNQNEKLVIITHHAPSKRSVPQHFCDNILSAAYASHLDNFVAQSKADLWVHGHMHSFSDYTLGNTRVVCNPRGYPDEPTAGFDPGLVIEV